MSEENIPSSIDEFSEQGHEFLADAQAGAKNLLGSTAEYIRANPWAALAGAAVLGGALATMIRPRHRATSVEKSVRKFRDLLEEGLAKLPTQKQVEEVAEASGVPCFLKKLAHGLHIS